jgi:uncharacterized protein
MLDIAAQWPMLLSLAAMFAVGGAVAGGIAGLFGIGGGVIMVPMLTTALKLVDVPGDVAIHVAIATSLAAIIPTSFISYRMHAKLGAIDHDLLWRWSPWIVVGAIGGSLMTNLSSTHVLGILFAMSCGFLALQFWREQKNQEVPLRVLTKSAECGIAFTIGVLSSMIGLGGGIFGVMVMSSVGHPIHRAVATASAMGFLVAVPSTVVHLLGFGPNAVIPLGTIGMVHPVALLLLIPAAMVMAPIGARLAHRLPAAKLRRGFALLLVLLALKMVYSSLT